MKWLKTQTNTFTKYISPLFQFAKNDNNNLWTQIFECNNFLRLHSQQIWTKLEIGLCTKLLKRFYCYINPNFGNKTSVNDMIVYEKLIQLNVAIRAGLAVESNGTHLFFWSKAHDANITLMLLFIHSVRHKIELFYYTRTHNIHIYI